MKTFDEFFATHKVYTEQEHKEKFDYDYKDFMYEEDHDNILKIHDFNDGCYITELTDNRFYMMIERSDYYTDNLFDLAEILWDTFLKDEFRVTESDFENDLHERIRNFMDKEFPGICCSLDEIDLDRFNEKQIKKREYYMKLFDNLHTH